MLIDFTPFSPQTLIRALTILSLGVLLLTVGMRLDLRSVARAVMSSRLLLVVLPLNFILVPVLVSAVVWGFSVPPELAAGLTAILPVFSAFLTPLVFEASLSRLSYAGYADALNYFPLRSLAILFDTVTLPILVGMALRQALPALVSRMLAPLKRLVEAAGAVSLAFVTYVEFEGIVGTGLKSLLAMVMAGELSFMLGFALGGPKPASRQVIAFGTANRNIALALLVAIDSFAGTPVVAVVSNGLLLIFLGLLHVAFYRLAGWKRKNNCSG